MECETKASIDICSTCAIEVTPHPQLTMSTKYYNCFKGELESGWNVNMKLLSFNSYDEKVKQFITYLIKNKDLKC